MRNIIDAQIYVRHIAMLQVYVMGWWDLNVGCEPKGTNRNDTAIVCTQTEVHSQIIWEPKYSTTSHGIEIFEIVVWSRC